MSAWTPDRVVAVLREVLRLYAERERITTEAIRLGRADARAAMIVANEHRDAHMFSQYLISETRFEDYRDQLLALDRELAALFSSQPEGGSL